MISILDVYQDHGMDWYEEGREPKNSYRIILETFGKCVYWVNECKYIMNKGDILLIPSHLSYYGKSIPTLFHTKDVIHFRKTDPEPGLSILDLDKPLYHRLGCYDVIHERFKSIRFQWTDRPSYYALMADALLMEVLIYVNQEWDRGEIPAERHRHVERMKEYIQNHYREKVGKEELGEVIQKTPNYAATLLKTITHQTISEHVHSQRIKTAMYLLTESRLTISEISEYVGYSDVSYFHRIFKRTTGSSPSDFLHERSSIV